MILTLMQQNLLLAIAKRTIELAIYDRPIPDFIQYENKFSKNFGAFVTLYNEDQLRGCIGYIQPVATLIKTVSMMSKSAALEDPRFHPVRKEEYDKLTIEISVLSPLVFVSNISEIEVGRDGLLIRNGWHQGLLLPQVALREQWEVLTFLQQTCRKAGLLTDDWEKEDTEIFRFSAEIFSQEITKILDIERIT